MYLEGIDRQSRAYVTSRGPVGFAEVERRRRALWDWVGQECPDLRQGYRKHYADYRAAFAAALEHCDYLRRHGARNWQCPVDLSPDLRGLEGRRVEVTYPDGRRSQFVVGVSAGWLPVHLELADHDSTSGTVAHIPQGATVRAID